MRTVALALGCLLALTLTLLPSLGGNARHAPGVDAQEQDSPLPTYEYSVLPGVQKVEASWTTPIDLSVSQGWHSGRTTIGGSALDLVASGGYRAGATVYAVIRSDKPSTEITADVAEVIASGTGCRLVQINFYERGVSDPIGRAIYTHVNADSALQTSVTLPARTGPDGITKLKIGTIAAPSWRALIVSRSDGTHGPQDDVAGRIQAEINRRLAATPPTLSATGAASVGSVQEVTVGGETYRVRRMFGPWYEQSWRPGTTQPADSDGANCPTTGPHLHQAADTSRLAALNFPESSMWRNLAFGTANFCSDTWIFKLYPPAPSSVALDDWRPDKAALRTCASDMQPSFGTATIADLAAVQGRAVGSITLPAATGGNDARVYNLWPALPEGLTFDTASRVLSGTPSALKARTEYIWTATDTDGDTAVLPFNVAVSAPPPLATLALMPTTIYEGGSLTSTTRPNRSTVTATLDGPAPAGGASLVVSATSRTATIGRDYTLSGTKLSFLPGATKSTGTVTLTASHDGDTSNESVRVSATASGAVAPTSVTLTIVDDDTPRPPPVTTPACTVWGASIVWLTVDGSGAGSRLGSAFRTHAAATKWLNDNVTSLTRNGTRNITHQTVYCTSQPTGCSSSWTSYVLVRNTATDELVELVDTGFPTRAHAVAVRDATVAIIRIAQIVETDVYCGTSRPSSESAATQAAPEAGAEGAGDEAAGARVSEQTRSLADGALATFSSCVSADGDDEWACLKAFAQALDTIHQR